MNLPVLYYTQVVNRFKFSLGKFLKELGLHLDRYGSIIGYDIAFKQRLSRAQTIKPLYDHKPDVRNAWIAPNAHL